MLPRRASRTTQTTGASLWTRKVRNATAMNFIRELASDSDCFELSVLRLTARQRGEQVRSQQRRVFGASIFPDVSVPVNVSL